MQGREKIFLKILIPTKPLVKKDVFEIEIPAIEGPYLVLPKRAPTIKLLNNGIVRVKETKDSPVEEYFVSEGVAKVRENACTLMINEGIKKEDIVLEKIKAELKKYKTKEKREAHLDTVDEKHTAFLNMIVGAFEK